jgi:hypothetical protein
MGGTVTSGLLTHGTSSLKVAILNSLEWAWSWFYGRQGREGADDFPAPPMRGTSCRVTATLQMRQFEIMRRSGAINLLGNPCTTSTLYGWVPDDANDEEVVGRHLISPPHLISAPILRIS